MTDPAGASAPETPSGGAPSTGGTDAGTLSHARTYFEAMYADDSDPWGFDSRWYEHRKYDLTLAALPDDRYRRAVEPGCANGALTERLAERCEELIAFDLIETVVANAERRLRGRTNVSVHTAEFPVWWPNGTGDLVVWSEVAYYLTPAGFDIAIAGLARWLEDGGTLVAAHYTGTTNYPMGGDECHERLDAVPFLTHVVGIEDPQFRIDVWQRTSR